MDAINERRLSRIREEYELYSAIEMGLTANPGEMTHIHLPPVRCFLRMHKRTMECVETGEPLLASAFNNPPEILTAMGVHWYFLFAQAFAGGFENPHIQEDLEALDKMPVPGDCCSLIRLGLRYLDAGLLPLPAAYLGVTEPCDGIIGVHEALRTHPEWRNVPSFGIDVPYWDDDHAVDYVAGELRRMVEFVTRHTGKTLDIKRLREVITESNEHYRLWQEYNELRRCKPSPHNYLLAQSCFLMTNFEGAGRPEYTPWFRDLVADAERRVRQNQPEVPNQRIRVLWFDLQPIYFNLIAPWLEQEWGVSVVMDMVSYCPYQVIDTSTEDSMFRGLARRLIKDPPMIRQARGAGGQLPVGHQPHRAGLPDRLRHLAGPHRPQGRRRQRQPDAGAVPGHERPVPVHRHGPVRQALHQPRPDQGADLALLHGHGAGRRAVARVTRGCALYPDGGQGCVNTA